MSEDERQKECLANEAGMSFRINRYTSRLMPQVPNWPRSGKAGGMDGPMKCEEMMNEATTLLKTKEVDLERTQIRSQFSAFFTSFELDIGTSWKGSTKGRDRSYKSVKEGDSLPAATLV